LPARLPFRQARRLDVLAEEQAGIVDQDVELAETADDRVDRDLPISSFILFSY